MPPTSDIPAPLRPFGFIDPNDTRLKARFWSKVNKKGPVHPKHGRCWCWEATMAGSYGQIEINRKQCKPHRVAWELKVGKIPDGLWVLHKCDNTICVNPKHLFLGTVADNTADMVSKGRQARGEKVSTARLTERDVIRIRRLKKRGVPLKEICRVYGAYGTVQKAASGETWRHLPCP